jgi:hypothetical protein
MHSPDSLQKNWYVHPMLPQNVLAGSCSQAPDDRLHVWQAVHPETRS